MSAYSSYGPPSANAGSRPADAKEIGDLPEKLPVYLLYGKADPVAPIAGGEALRDAMKKAGLEVTWRVLKEGGHMDVLEKGAADYLYWMLTAGR